MPRTTSNLTNDELRRIFNISENSPLYEYIKQTTNDYLSRYQQGGRSWVDISGVIKREILLIWKDFVDKYGPNRIDMNEIKERAQTNNYDLPQRGLPLQSYGSSGDFALLREILRWNREECNKLISILEYEERRDGGARQRAGIKHKRKHKSKKKRYKKKRSKKRKSKKR